MGSKHNNHHERDDLTGEHSLGDAGQIILACIFFLIWVLDTFFLKYTISLNQYISIWIRIPVGAILIIISGYLAYKSHALIFGDVRETPHVIYKSIYKITRHPMYLSEIIFYMGFLVMSISLAAIVIFVLTFCFLHFISRHEEKLLLVRFGKEYEEYMQKVSMWFPCFWKK